MKFLAARRKKNRVDTFYARILEIRERAPREPKEDLLEELATLEKEAFGLLIAERLAAEESFRIFTELLGQARSDLHYRRPLESIGRISWELGPG